MAAIRERYEIAVSPETVIELLNTLKSGTGNHFSHDQKRFRVCMCGERNARFLALPGEFVMKQALGIKALAKYPATHFRDIVQGIIAAKSHAQLLKGGVSLGQYGYVFNPGINHRKHEAGVVSHREWMKDAKSKNKAFPPPERWGIALADGLSVKIDGAQSITLTESLSAYYAFEQELFNVAYANPNLNVEKRDGDWVDGEQLIYLSEPTMHFLTEESKIKVKAANSDQRDRILILPEFLKDIGLSV